MTTTAHKIAFLESFGHTIGARDPRLNTNYPGTLMVVEATHHDIDDYDLPTEDGANGPFCMVGDDLEELVDLGMNNLLSLDDEFNEIEKKWEAMCVIPEADLPPRQYLTLDAQSPDQVPATGPTP